MFLEYNIISLKYYREKLEKIRSVIYVQFDLVCSTGLQVMNITLMYEKCLLEGRHTLFTNSQSFQSVVHILLYLIKI